MTTGTSCTYHYSLLSPQVAGISGGKNRFNVDPLIAPSTGSYEPQAGSPAIDAADPGSTLGIDLRGLPRPQGLGRDMGAFEVQPLQMP